MPLRHGRFCETRRSLRAEGESPQVNAAGVLTGLPGWIVTAPRAEAAGNDGWRQGCGATTPTVSWMWVPRGHCRFWSRTQSMVRCGMQIRRALGMDGQQGGRRRRFTHYVNGSHTNRQGMNTRFYLNPLASHARPNPSRPQPPGVRPRARCLFPFCLLTSTPNARIRPDHSHPKCDPLHSEFCILNYPR